MLRIDCRCARCASLGADRIELNLALELGGLTPSVGLLQAAKRTTTIPIMVMIRPHNGPYDYSEG
jgi:copper homeostasis protein